MGSERYAPSHGEEIYRIMEALETIAKELKKIRKLEQTKQETDE